MISTGKGFLVAGIGFAALLLTEVVSESITEDDCFYQANPWVISVGMTLAALLTFGLHKLLSRKKPVIAYNRETGEEIEIHDHHSFLFLPLKWWPRAFVLIGCVLSLIGTIGTDFEAPPATEVMSMRGQYYLTDGVIAFEVPPAEYQSILSLVNGSMEDTYPMKWGGLGNLEIQLHSEVVEVSLFRTNQKRGAFRVDGTYYRGGTDAGFERLLSFGAPQPIALDQ